MPKQALTINDFSGGLTTDISPRDLEGNQLEYCTNVDPSRKGRLTNSRIFKDADATVQNNVDFVSVAHGTPGYGLFVFGNDNEVQPGHAVNADDFLLKADGTTVDVQELSDGTKTDDQLGTTSATPAFYAADGDVFASGDHSTTPTSLVWHYQKKMNGPARTVADWVQETQTKVPPVKGTDMLISEMGATTAGLGKNELNWIISYGDAADGGGDNNGGTWNNTYNSALNSGLYMEFGGTWLYKGWNIETATNAAESDIVFLGSGSDNGYLPMEGNAASHVNTTLRIRAWMSASPDATTLGAGQNPDTMYGARLYARQNGEHEWYLVAECNFEKGIKGDLETEWGPWEAGDDNSTLGVADFDHADSGHQCTTGQITDPPALLTFKILNGFSADDIIGTVYWRHGTVANSRAYVGDVSINGRVHGDKILKSPIFQYDIFTENAFIDVAANDGDSITALEAYADRLLEFKKKTLYIINVSKELEFLEDVRVGAGVDNPAAVTKTPFGVVWANQTGCFLYDGDKISQLHMGKLSNTDWSNVTENVIVGYDFPSRQIVVLWNGATAGSGEAFVYTLDTQSWHLVDDMMFHAANVTNMVNTSDGELLIGGGVASGGATQGEVSVYAARGDTSQIDMRTGQLSLGNPAVKKNLANVKVRYKYGGSNLAVSIITNDDSDDIGETTTVLSGSLTDTSGNMHTKEYNTLGTAAFQNQYWFQVKISATAHQSFELDEVVLTYRELGVR